MPKRKKYGKLEDLKNDAGASQDAHTRWNNYVKQTNQDNQDFWAFQGHNAFRTKGGADFEKNDLDLAQAYANEQEARTGKRTFKGFKFKNKQEGKKYGSKGARDTNIQAAIDQQRANRLATVSEGNVDKENVTDEDNYKSMLRVGRAAWKKKDGAGPNGPASVNMDTFDAMIAAKSDNVTNDEKYKEFYGDYQNEIESDGSNNGFIDSRSELMADRKKARAEGNSFYEQGISKLLKKYASKKAKK